MAANVGDEAAAETDDVARVSAFARELAADDAAGGLAAEGPTAAEDGQAPVHEALLARLGHAARVAWGDDFYQVRAEVVPAEQRPARAAAQVE